MGSPQNFSLRRIVAAQVAKQAGSLSGTALRALTWAATRNHGPFVEGLGFTRTSLEALQRKGLIEWNSAAMPEHEYDYSPVEVTLAGRRALELSKKDS